MFDWLMPAPTPRKFADALMRFAVRSGFSEPIHFDEENFRFLTGVKRDATINLENMFREFRAAPRRDRDRLLARYATLLSSPALPASFAQARPDLLPVIRSRSWAEHVRLAGIVNDETNTTPWVPFGSDAVIMIALDRPESMSMLTASHFSDWNIDFDTALQAARDNLRDASAGQFEQLPGGVWSSTWSDSYDSSRILFADIVHRTGLADPVAMIPTRDRLLVASGGDPAAQLAMLACAAAAFEEEGRPVSASMFHFRDGKAQVFEPLDAQVGLQAGNFARYYRAEDYAAQKRMLDEINEKRGIDLFVATYALLEYEGRADLVSECTWSEGVETLLPETDRVALVRFDEAGQPHSLGAVDWAQLQRVAGHLMTPRPDEFPIRYHVTQFPDISQLNFS